MNKKEIRKAIKEIFSEAKIKFIYDIAQITNWREMENGKYNARYTGKCDFYEKIRNAGLKGYVICGA